MNDERGRTVPIAATGDGAFTRFYDTHAAGLVRLAYLLLGDRGAAEEVVQDVLLELYRRWPTLQPDTTPAYARRAVVNRSRSVLRRRQVAARLRPRLFSRQELEPPSPEHLWVLDAVRALPRRQREVVVLRYWLDLSEAQIAQTLGIGPGTVKSSASRALAALAAPAARHLGRISEETTGDAMREGR